MCIVCKWDSGEEKIDTNIEVLYCCTTVTSIPMLPKLKMLDCSSNTVLTSIPILPRLEKLYCQYCTSLTSIPELPKLYRLCCGWCRNIKNIPELLNLKELHCSYTSITSLPVLPKLEILNCRYCKTLTNIPKLPKLIRLHCSGDQCLTSIHVPSGTDTVGLLGCKWISKCSSFNSNIEALRTCQAIFRRKLTAKKLERILPTITEIYYSPGCKGEAIARKNFELRAQIK
jgi:hypothetical protein